MVYDRVLLSRTFCLLFFPPTNLGSPTSGHTSLGSYTSVHMRAHTNLGEHTSKKFESTYKSTYKCSCVRFFAPGPYLQKFKYSNGLVTHITHFVVCCLCREQKCLNSCLFVGDPSKSSIKFSELHIYIVSILGREEGYTGKARGNS